MILQPLAILLNEAKLIGLPQSQVTRKALGRRLQKKGRALDYLAETTGDGSAQASPALATPIAQNLTTCACLVAFTKTKFSRTAQFGGIVGRFHLKN